VEKSELEELSRRLAAAEARIQAYRSTIENEQAESSELGPMLGQPEFEVIPKPGELPRTDAVIVRVAAIDEELTRRRITSVETDPRITTLVAERARLEGSITETHDQEVRELRRVRKEAMIRRMRELGLDLELTRSRLAEAERAADALRSQSTTLKETLRNPEPLATREERHRIESERTLHEGKIRSLEEERIQLQATLAYVDQGPVAQLDRAQRARSVSVESPLRSFFFYALVGLIAGVSIVLVLEYTSTTIRTENDVKRYVNLPLLGMIPRIRAEGERLLADQAPGSPLGEVFNTLGTILETYATENDARVFMIASPLPGEGKSTAISNIAVALARGGKRVVLIDCDLRRAVLHRFFDQESVPGLSTYLTSSMDPSQPEVRLDSIFRKTQVDKLTLVTAGQASSNPMAMLKSEAMNRVMERAREIADIVLVDVPPVKIAVDTLLLATRVDGTLMLVSSGETRKDAVTMAKRLLESANGKLIGCLLNKVTEQTAGYYYYTYYYSGGSKYYYES
jgi:capsular exopolysaccharide synthesis family protein